MTPRFAMDSGGNIVWRWEGEAFGDTLSKSDPDGNGKDVVVNLRFVGQYYDSESQLHYNYFRYYDPSIGRYISVDPLGIHGVIEQFGIQNFKAGDANLFLYVLANPLIYFDPDGEIYRTPGFNRPLHELLENLNDPRVPHSKRPPSRRKQPSCSCPVQPPPSQPVPGSFCQGNDPYYGGNSSGGPSLCSCK